MLYLMNDINEDARQQQLTSKEATALLAEWKVNEWKDLSGWYCRSLFDAPFKGLWSMWGGEVQVLPFDRPNCKPLVDEPKLEDVLEGLYAYVDEHHLEGSRLDGPVRYTLIPASIRDVDNNLLHAAPWPLDNFDQLMNDFNQQVEAGAELPVEVAKGEQADTLRAMRDRYLGGQLGDPSNNAIPGKQEDGTTWELRMRDVLPLEVKGHIEFPYSEEFLDSAP